MEKEHGRRREGTEGMKGVDKCKNRGEGVVLTWRRQREKERNYDRTNK
jgi:hypothetical protein